MNQISKFLFLKTYHFKCGFSTKRLARSYLALEIIVKLSELNTPQTWIFGFWGCAILAFQARILSYLPYYWLQFQGTIVNRTCHSLSSSVPIRLFRHSNQHTIIYNILSILQNYIFTSYLCYLCSSQLAA